jgi:hypothetical protein
MNKNNELNDHVEIRRFLAQGLWLQRIAAPKPASVPNVLRRARRLASEGEPVPPVGFIADVGQLVFGTGSDTRTFGAGLDVPGWPPGLSRAYEDLVLGKLDADASMARAADALARYRGSDRDKGMAFLLDRLGRRAGIGGVQLNPAVVKSALELRAEELLAEGWESLARDGPLPLLVTLYEALIGAVRDAAEALGPEDVFELEHGTALAAFSQRVALRQVLQAADAFEKGVALERPRTPARRHDVATRILDEDTYPVGGFSSISTRGSIESLLHSQLAYMEPYERPDLFDIKFLRDELLYYARDENRFLRRRRTFLFALDSDLARARIKDAGLPHQRIVLLLALLVAAVRKLIERLSDEALSFEFLFLEEGKGATLAPEQALVEMILREPIATGLVTTARIGVSAFAPRLAARSARSVCHVLTVTAAATLRDLNADPRAFARLRLDGPRPHLAAGSETLDPAESDDAWTYWCATLERLLTAWE